MAFDAGGLQSMEGISQMFGDVRSRNEALRQNQQAQSQNVFQFMAGQEALARQERLAERRLGAESRRQQRELAFRREESAFGRLNQTLERQLKISQIEAKRRDKAFENSMRVELFGLETRAKSMKLQQLERQVQSQDLMGELETLRFQYQAGEIQSPTTYAENLTSLTKRYRGGMAHLAATPEGQELIAGVSAQIQAAKLSLEVPDLDASTYGEKLNRGDVEKLATKVDLNRPMGDNEQQAVSLLVQEALTGVSGEEIAQLNLGEISAEEAALQKVTMYAKSKEGNAHWDHLVDQLKTPGGRARFRQMYRTDSFSPIQSQEQLSDLQALSRAQQQELATMIERTGGLYLSSPEFRDAREDMKDRYRRAKLEIYSDNEPNSALAREGAISFDIIHEEFLDQANKDGAVRTAKDLFEVTGIPQASRVVRDIVTGRRIQGSDVVDAALAAMIFVPGVGWAARGALGVGKWALGKVGVSALRNAGLRPVAAEAFARTAKLGQAARARQIVASTARPGSTVVNAVGQEIRGAAAESVRKVAQRNLPAASRAVREAATPALREVAGATGVGAVGYRMIRGTSDFRELEQARSEVDEVLADINALADRDALSDPRIMMRLEQRMEEYKRVASKYLGRDIPLHLERQLFDLKNIVPPRIARQLQRNYRRELRNAGNPTGVSFLSNQEILTAYGGATASRPVAQPSLSGTTPTSGGSSGEFSFLDQPPEPE
jgi:hypothetical protein